MNNWYALAVVLVLVGLPACGEEPGRLVPPKGSVLVELKLNEAVAAGFAGPGSRVDVVFKTTEPKTTVVLEDLLVYAVDTDTRTFTYSVGMTNAQSRVVAPLIKDNVRPQVTLRAPSKK
ncbi:hypothetical protein [Frigoriglobus tundricola]|uniref:Uncharacterized protein n=1 Tax=Frigoriglobus tundricola TaxID=2774151 RepID=A0A6M5YW97_9BACT|nr:hypothetical protein [Frigoriglobus tundricola]QJW97581.1 hypothetical protein FTUN_5156 [Frigoriglobus tundricola]